MADSEAIYLMLDVLYVKAMGREIKSPLSEDGYSSMDLYPVDWFNMSYDTRINILNEAIKTKHYIANTASYLKSRFCVKSGEFTLTDENGNIITPEGMRKRIKALNSKEVVVSSSQSSVQYFRLESGNLVRLTNKTTVHSLGADGEWIPNQYAYSIFVDGMRDYEEISSSEAQIIADERKKSDK